jgi:uncharacterized membrane protein YeaQ/YmgE (transglycosylase-associated protein family)
VLGLLLQALLSGFIVGGLARWAVPGPDPMPIWLTTLFGLAGSVVGGLIAVAAFGSPSDFSKSDYFVAVLLQILAAALLVVAYRRFVQKRPAAGPKALEPPTRGWGLGRRRAAPRVVTRREALDQLDELHDRGELSDEEYLERRRRVLRSG